ncbi:unnamed protein product [Onchocerca flexuosa]|uniref:Secreted protein n=1 Tax=Onchocerca flexuosa TaxID=387005 RepID=A0A183H2Q3_9BILA|nr:unnamed protein product [Onchocerca flexuosa]
MQYHHIRLVVTSLGMGKGGGGGKQGESNRYTHHFAIMLRKVVHICSFMRGCMCVGEKCAFVGVCAWAECVVGACTWARYIYL